MVKRLSIVSCVIALIICFTAAPVSAQAAYTPAPENLKAREWFQDAKFGLFVHWGVYCLLAKGEWVMYQDKIPVKSYEGIPGNFNPAKFDPDEWCRMVKAAGMNYITITSKHHDGFAMFDSKVSDYDVVDKTPYKKDILKMLADACQRNGLKLFFYHSQLDWHNTDYYPRGGTDTWYTGRPDRGEWNKYLDYMDGQLKELCTNYGPIGGIWFDGMWDKPDADWRLEKTYGLIHSLQPAAMVGSNHHRKPFAGEDFQMFEKGLPGNDPFSTDKNVSVLPLETCETMNDSWGYNESDKKYKSVKDLIQYLVKAAGNNANFLLNVGPRPDGTIQPEFVERLTAMGKWLKANGESVYGTRGGPVPPQSWGVTTRKPGFVYLHVLSSDDQYIALPNIDGKIKGMKRLVGNEPVEYSQSKTGIIVKVPKENRDEYDTVIVVSMDK